MIKDVYDYVRRNLPGPWAGNYAFLPNTSLPMEAIQGPGTFSRGSLQTIQPGQFVYLQRQTIIGLAGTISGENVTQPLLLGDARGNI